MKLLTHIRLINWHLFENTTVNCQGTTYFIGINGAGKSTVLDAVQFALVGGQRDVRFNQAALAGGKLHLCGRGRHRRRGRKDAWVAVDARDPPELPGPARHARAAAPASTIWREARNMSRLNVNA